MHPPQNVLITGVGGYWGKRVAARLVTESSLHVLGLDSASPAERIRGLDFIQADVRTPLMVDLLTDEQIHTICHLAFLENVRPTEATFDLNVMGAMKLFGAAATAGVTKIVLKSSMMVYGARADNSAFLGEERTLAIQGGSSRLRDLLEVEAFCNGFRGQSPHMSLTVLRFPNIVGPQADTPLTRFLSSQFTPTLMGFDPLMQVIHEDDVVEALAHAVLHDAPGVFNVAAEEVLPLSKLMALAGKFAPPIFHLAAYWGNPVLSSMGLPVARLWPLPLDYLRYSWVGDLNKMRSVLDFTPRYTATEALREFAGRKRLRNFALTGPEAAEDETHLRERLERRRAQQYSTGPAQNEPEVISEDVSEDVL